MRDIRKRRIIILIASAIAIVLATAAYIIIPAGITDIEVLTTKGERLEESYAVYIGESVQLECKIKPKTFAARKVVYKSSDDDILSVNETGLITGVKEGQVRLSVECADVRKSVIVEVEPSVKEIKGVEEEVTLFIGEEYQLNPKVIMSSKELDQPVIKYKSKRTKIATVDNNGKITAIGEGTTRVTIKAGTEKVKIKVTVENVTADVVSTPTFNNNNNAKHNNAGKVEKKNKKSNKGKKNNSDTNEERSNSTEDNTNSDDSGSDGNSESGSIDTDESGSEENAS